MWRSFWGRVWGTAGQSNPLDTGNAEPTTILFAHFDPKLGGGDSEDQAPPAKNVAEPNRWPGSKQSHVSPAVSRERAELAPKQASQASIPRNRLRVFRFSRRFSGMTVTEARILFNIHRRTVGSLASESSTGLLRDMRRFAFSSRGQRILGGAELPELTRVRSWIAQAGAQTTVLGNSGAKPVSKLTA